MRGTCSICKAECSLPNIITTREKNYGLCSSRCLTAWCKKFLKGGWD